MISVVIATYNGQKYIEEQLRSVLLQTARPDEVLIFDDGSTDATAEIVSRFIEQNGCDGWHLILNEQNKGYCLNFLEGALNTKGDLIFLCDQDDVWHPEKIEVMSEAMRADSDIMALCCACDLIDGQGNAISDSGNIGVLFSNNDGGIEEFATERFVGRSFIRGCSMGFKRELLGHIAPLELKGLLSHDWLITFTAALNGKCAVLNRVLMSYRCHDSNTSFGQRKYGQKALQKRTEALECSVDGHKFILENADCYPKMTDALKQRIKKHIAFENKRVEYLKNGGIKNIFKCFLALYGYKCYYGSFASGVRVFLGDFSYRKNRKK